MERGSWHCLTGTCAPIKHVKRLFLVSIFFLSSLLNSPFSQALSVFLFFFLSFFVIFFSSAACHKIASKYFIQLVKNCIRSKSPTTFSALTCFCCTFLLFLLLKFSFFLLCVCVVIANAVAVVVFVLLICCPTTILVDHRVDSG